MPRAASAHCHLFRVALFFFFQAEDGIRYADVTGVQTCALPICPGGELAEVIDDARFDAEPVELFDDWCFVFHVDDCRSGLVPCQCRLLRGRMTRPPRVFAAAGRGDRRAAGSLSRGSCLAWLDRALDVGLTC